MIYTMSDIHGNIIQLERRINQIINKCSFNFQTDKIVFLGDYIGQGDNSYKVLCDLKMLEDRYGHDHIIILRGNHDEWFLDFVYGNNTNWIFGDDSRKTIKSFLTEDQYRKIDALIKLHEFTGSLKAISVAKNYLKGEHSELLRWMKQLHYYYENENQIYVHAGINENAMELWHVGTADYIFTNKYPAAKGVFIKDIIAGHISTSSITGDKDYHDIFYDGDNHYYIDGIDGYDKTVGDEQRKLPVLVYDEKKHKYYELSESENTFVKIKRQKVNGEDK